MKFGPKETKELNQYLRTGRNRTREFVTDNVNLANGGLSGGVKSGPPPEKGPLSQGLKVKLKQVKKG